METKNSFNFIEVFVHNKDYLIIEMLFIAYCLCMIVFVIIKYLRIEKNGIAIIGKIIKYRFTARAGPQPIVEYDSEEGKKKAYIQGRKSKHLELGDTIEILCSPRYPDTVLLKDRRYRVIDLVKFFGGGALGLTMEIASIYYLLSN